MVMGFFVVNTLLISLDHNSTERSSGNISCKEEPIKASAGKPVGILIVEFT